MGSDRQAQIWGVMAASGTGKGVWIKSQLAALKPRRIMVWDFMDEYQDAAGSKAVASLRDMVAMVRDAGDGPLRLRYRPRGAGEKALRKEFEAMCEVVYAAQDVTFIAEELANVTTPGWAPGAWRKMTTSGRHAGVRIIGVTQTPALVDKTFLGNCTLIHAGPLREAQHRIAVARSMDIDEGRLAALVKFQWIEKDFDSGEVTTGFTYPKGFKPAPMPRRASGTPTDAPTSGRGARGASKVATR